MSTPSLPATTDDDDDGGGISSAIMIVEGYACMQVGSADVVVRQA